MTAPNASKGEAEFRGLKLRMDFDSFRGLEGVTGKKMPRLCTEFELGLGLDDLAQWIRCFAVGEVSDADVAAAIHQGGMMADYDAVNKVLGQLMQDFFRPGELAKGKRPPKAE